MKRSGFAYHDGTKVDGKTYLERGQGLSGSAGLDKPEQVGLTALAADLFSESSPGSPGRAFYSQLSGMLFATCRLVLYKVTDHFGVDQEYAKGWRGGAS